MAVPPTQTPSTTKEVPMTPPVEQPGLPEAGGVAWVDLYCVHTTKDEQGRDHRHVIKISLTSRATTPTVAFERLLTAIKLAEKDYGFLPYPV